MELPEKKSPEEIQARAALLQSAKLNGYKVDWVQWGFRKFEAILVPGTEHDFHEYIKEESNSQKRIIREGRCIIGSDAGGVKRCPERIPNPLYGEPGQPKTVYNDCVTCPHNKDGCCGHMASISHSGEYSEDGEEYDIDIPVGIAPDDYIYEFYCEQVMEFVRKKYPKAEGMMELLLQGMEKTEIARTLGVHRNTPGNQLKAMKEDLLKFIDTILIFD